MADKKKFQVFVSSTYEDLKEERQAAVEAILRAGHIPAGMELFTSGDESQMQVINNWIDESDIYLLILGGRYGSIEKKSGKSYTELEYDYALRAGKRLFALVITEEHLEEKVKKFGSTVKEWDHPDRLRKFRQFVCRKMVRFWNNSTEIKVAILETLIAFSKDADLIGWIPSDEALSPKITEELARLTKENSELKSTIEKLDKHRFSGLSFSELIDLLNKTILKEDEINFLEQYGLKDVIKIFGNNQPSLLHALWVISQKLQKPQGMLESHNVSRLLQKLVEFKLVQAQRKSGVNYYFATENGKEFLLRVKLNFDLE